MTIIIKATIPTRKELVSIEAKQTTNGAEIIIAPIVTIVIIIFANIDVPVLGVDVCAGSSELKPWYGLVCE